MNHNGSIPCCYWPRETCVSCGDVEHKMQVGKRHISPWWQLIRIYRETSRLPSGDPMITCISRYETSSPRMLCFNTLCIAACSWRRRGLALVQARPCGGGSWLKLRTRQALCAHLKAAHDTRNCPLSDSASYNVRNSMREVIVSDT
jgi:hypothetical protein